MDVYQELRDNILCRLYYKKMPQFNLIKVYAPFDKSVYYIKSEDELHNICEKLFRKGYFEGKKVDVFTENVTKSVFARSVVYWLSRTGTDDELLDREVKELTIREYLFPLLEKCKCSDRTKERFLEEFDEYLEGKIDIRELLLYFSTRIIKLEKGFHLHRVKIA